MLATSHLHPVSVHFAVALVLLGFMADVLCLVFKKEQWLLKASYFLMIVAAVSTIAAYLTGALFTNELSGPNGELEERHELFAKITLAIILITTTFRIYLVIKKLDTTPLKWLVFLFYAATAVFIGITGYLGGSLVYDHLIKLT